MGMGMSMIMSMSMSMGNHQRLALLVVPSITMPVCRTMCALCTTRVEVKLFNFVLHKQPNNFKTPNRMTALMHNACRKSQTVLHFNWLRLKSFGINVVIS
jgi:hypothetical protein